MIEKCSHVWETRLIPKFHTRYCKKCHLTQYNYDGTWRDKITLEQFLDKWIGGVGDNYEFYNWATIEVSLPFERVVNEAWDYFYRVTFTRGRLDGVKTDWNQNANGLDADLRRQGLLPHDEYLRKKGEERGD